MRDDIPIPNAASSIPPCCRVSRLATRPATNPNTRYTHSSNANDNQIPRIGETRKGKVPWPNGVHVPQISTGGLCKTPEITSLRTITWHVQKAGDTPYQVMGNGFSSR